MSCERRSRRSSPSAFANKPVVYEAAGLAAAKLGQACRDRRTRNASVTVGLGAMTEPLQGAFGRFDPASMPEGTLVGEDRARTCSTFVTDPRHPCRRPRSEPLPVQDEPP